MNGGDTGDVGVGGGGGAGERAAEVVDTGVAGVGGGVGVVGVGVQLEAVGVAGNAAAEVVHALIGGGTGEDVFTEVAEQAGFLAEIERRVGGAAEGVAGGVDEVIADGIRRDERAAEVGVGFSVDELGVHIDVDRVGVEAEHTEVVAMVGLPIIGDLEADEVAEKRLAERGVERAEVGLFAFVGTVEELVVEIKNRGIAQLLVTPQAAVGLASGSELLVEEKEGIVALRGVTADCIPLGIGRAAAAAHEGRDAVAALHGGSGIGEDGPDGAEPATGGAELGVEERIVGDVAGRGGIEGDLVENVKPRGDAIVRGIGAGAVGVLRAALVVDLQLGETGLDETRLEFEGGEHAAVLFEGGLLAVAFLFIERDHADAEEAPGDGLVEVEDFAVGFETSDGLLELEGILLEICGFELVIDDTGGAAEAEEDGVGAARDVDALRVVGIHRNIRQEEIAGEIGAGETAHAGRAAGALERALGAGETVAGADAGEVALEAAGLGVGGVNEDVAEVGRAGVDHELRSHDGDGGADVAEIGAEARAGEGAGRGVSAVLGLRDHERSELQGFVRTCGGGGGLGGGRRGGGLGAEVREAEQTERAERCAGGA